MASTDGTIKVKLGLDDSEYKSGLSGAVSKAESFADKVKSTFVGAVAFKAASKGFDLITGSIGKATNRLDALKQSTQVMTVLTGSTETATAIVNKLTDAVSDTAYGLDTASSATQKLMTSGLGAEQSAQYIQDLMDAVAFYGDGTNETLANVADGISKMNSSQKISADQWQRLTDAGIPVIKMFAEKTGKSMADVQSAFEKGDISVDEFNQILTDCLENGTESFPAVAGKAKEMAGSFATSFSNMSARIAIGVANIITAFNNFLEDSGLPSIQTMIADFGSVVKNVLNKIAELIPTALGGLRDYLTPLGDTVKIVIDNLKDAWGNLVWLFKDTFEIPSLDQIKEKLELVRDKLAEGAVKSSEFIKNFTDSGLPKVVDILEKLAPVIVSVGTAIVAWKKINEVREGFEQVSSKASTFLNLMSKGSGVIDGVASALSGGSGVIASMAESFTLAGGGIEGFSAALGVVGGPVTLVIVAIAALAAGFIYLWNTSDEFRAFWINVWEEVKKKAQEAYNYLKPYIDKIGETIELVIPIIQNALQGLWEALQNLWNTVQPLLEQLGQAFSAAFESLAPVLETVWNAITQFAGVVLSLIPGVITTFASLVTVVINIITWIVNLGTTLINIVTTDIPQFIEGVVDWFSQLPENVKNFIDQVIENVTTWASDMVAKAQEMGSNFLDNIKEFFSQLPGKVKEHIDNAFEKVKTWATNMKDKAKETGKNFLEGIGSSISQLPGKIWNWLSQAISNVASFASQFVSQAVSSGTQFFNGIVDEVSKIPAQMISIGGQIVNGIKSGISNGWSQLTSWLGGLASGLVDTVKGFLGIHSPSKAFADEVGLFIPSGITKGAKKALPKALRFMTSLSDDLLDAARLDDMSARLSITGAKGASGLSGNATVYNVEQTINSAKALTPSEIATETQNMMRRLAWV